MLLEIKKKVYLYLEPDEESSNSDRIFNYFIIALIILNTLAVIFETVDSLFLKYQTVFKNFEFFSIIVFSIEYILRLWTCNLNKKYNQPFTGRIRYIFSFAGLIDLVAILPFYLPFFIKVDFRFLRIIRLIRLLRFFKLGRYLHAASVIKKVLIEKKEELILSLGITFFLIIIASSLMYFVEHDAQPDKFSSIPETMWWSVATLTTVGYGDVYPITTLGKTLTSIISILGIGVFALPAGILASGFSNRLKKDKHCPNCGGKID